MKLVMDEKLKHRLIGLAVIISLGAIFAPAMMKKSSQKLDGNFTVNIKLPPKPLAPNVVSTDEKELFQTIKVSKVKMPEVPENTQSTNLAKAQPLKSSTLANQLESYSKTMPLQVAARDAANNSVKRSITVATAPAAKKSSDLSLKDKKPTVKVAPSAVQTKVAAKAQNKKTLYAVQLASFSQQANAQALVNKLRAKGYKANFTKIAGVRGAFYKVFAGYSPHKPDVLKLKTELASAMQLHGFIVNTEVS